MNNYDSVPVRPRVVKKVEIKSFPAHTEEGAPDTVFRMKMFSAAHDSAELTEAEVFFSERTLGLLYKQLQIIAKEHPGIQGDKKQS